MSQHSAQQSPDRLMLYVTFTGIVITTTFVSSVILGTIILHALPDALTISQTLEDKEYRQMLV